MERSNTKFRIHTLLQLAKITDDDVLREQILLEIMGLLDDMNTQTEIARNSEFFDEDAVSAIEEYIKDKSRVCVIQIWQEALGKRGRPQKYQATEINDIMSQMPEWNKLPKVARFGKYGPQAGFQKKLFKESEE